MKKTYLFATIGLFGLIALAGCKNTPKEETIPPPDPPVNSIHVTGVELNKRILGVVVGEIEDDLVATITPSDATNQNLVWTSSDPETVEVDPETGELTPVAATAQGEYVTITVTTEDGEFEDTCLVNVTDGFVPLVAIYVGGTTYDPARVDVGETIRLEVTYDPWNATNKEFIIKEESLVGAVPYLGEAQVQWSQEEVATAKISDDDPFTVELAGIVGADTALFVIADEGSDNITAVRSVHINRLIIGLALAPTSATIAVWDRLTLTPAFTPILPDVQTLEWESSNTEIARVDNGIVSGIAASTEPVTITARTTDGTNIEAACTVTVVEPDVEHPFGAIAFRSDATWTIGGYVWSDWVIASRCDGTFDPSDANGDCVQNIDGETRYYDLFSYYAINKYGTALCSGEWRAPTLTEYRALDIALYPRQEPVPWSNRNPSGSEEYVSRWGAEYGGFYNGTEITGRETDARIWTADMMWMGSRYPFVILYSNPAQITEIGSQSGRPTNNFGMGLRCVKDI